MVRAALKAVSCGGNVSCVTWAGHLASLNLRFRICKTGVIKVPTS